jgi:hypothetical protein
MGSVKPLPAGLTLDDFSVEIIGDLHLSDEERKEIEENWLVETAENPSLEKNPVHFVAQESSNGRHYRVYRSTYDVFKWIRKTGKRQELYLVNVVTILEGENFLLFAESGPNTLHAGKIVPVGGMLDHKNMSSKNPFYSNYEQELGEELGLNANNPKHISSYYVAYLGRRNSQSVELIVLAKTPLGREQLQNHQQFADAEFSRLYFLRKKVTEVEKFLRNTPTNKKWENLEPVLRDMFQL